MIGAERPFAQGPLLAPAVEFLNETMAGAIGAPAGLVLLPYAAVRGPGRSASEGGRPKRGRGAVAPEQRGGATGRAAEGVPPAGGGGGGGGSSSAGGVCPPAAAGTPIKNGKLCCDACDGEHKTTECPVFKGKARDKHKDAQKGKGPSIGKPGGNFVLRTARVVRQPGDGSCLFHSMSYGLGGTSASSLRRGIAACEHLRQPRNRAQARLTAGDGCRTGEGWAAG